MAGEAPSVAAGRQPDVILARLEVDYVRQLYYRVGERLPVRSWVTRLGTRSFTMRQELLQDDAVVIRLDAVLVVFDMSTGTSRPLSGDERAFWSRCLQE